MFLLSRFVFRLVFPFEENYSVFFSLFTFFSFFSIICLTMLEWHFCRLILSLKHIKLRGQQDNLIKQIIYHASFQLTEWVAAAENSSAMVSAHGQCMNFASVRLRLAIHRYYSSESQSPSRFLLYISMPSSLAGWCYQHCLLMTTELISQMDERNKTCILALETVKKVTKNKKQNLSRRMREKKKNDLAIKSQCRGMGKSHHSRFSSSSFEQKSRFVVKQWFFICLLLLPVIFC